MSSKPRQPRLRASCDGCFLAKVKCSKARPICSRCLACGIECRYSPSSRAGKPKADSNSGGQGNSHPSIPELHLLADDRQIIYNRQQLGTNEHVYRVDAGWNTPPLSADGNISRNPSISTGLELMGIEEQPFRDPETMSAPAESYPMGFPWTPPHDLSAQFGDAIPGSHNPSEHVRSQSFDVSMSNPYSGWADPSMYEMASYTQVQMPTPGSLPSNYLSSPTTTPSARPKVSRHKTSPSGSAGSGGSCTCFTACLQSLQALHNASAPATPPFDLVLSLNRKAVEGCAAMLACSKCMSRSGTHTAAMLLATIIGKITSFYKNASHSYFQNGGISFNAASSPNSALGVSFGAYQLEGEDGRWLELEILARELRKLEEVYARFREVCSEMAGNPDISKAMIEYLGTNLGSTLEVVNHRKGDVSYA